MLLIKQDQIAKLQVQLDGFDFRGQDKAKTKDLVDDIDVAIAELNNERYSLRYNQKKIREAMEDGNIAFDPEQAAQLFQEVGVLFEGQLKRDYEQLISFNTAITEERQGYLQEEKAEIDAQLKKVNAELNQLNKRRTAALSFLGDTDVFHKYKEASEELVVLHADVRFLEEQRKHLHALQELRSKIRAAEEEKSHLEAQLEREFGRNAEGIYETIQLLFNGIIHDVLDQNALLTASLNQQNHPEFAAEILDDSGNKTSAERGHTYKKLLCIAFDLAVLRAHLGHGFPSFVYQDGVFESLDSRKKENLLEVMREYADQGIQQIITLIDTDMPPDVAGEPPFTEDEIVLRLHDEGRDGRLFKLPSW